MNVKFSREPAVWVAVIGALLIWLAGFQIDWLSTGQATAITAALAGLVTAVFTRPVAPALFVAAVAPIAALFSEYGLHWTEAQVTGLTGLITALGLAAVVRPQVTPVGDQAAISPASGQVR